jgi:hypothetical protein
MARYQCRACDFDGPAEWRGTLACPRCGSTTQVRAAIAIAEMTDEEINAIASSRMDARHDHLDAELE